MSETRCADSQRRKLVSRTGLNVSNPNIRSNCKPTSRRSELECATASQWTTCLSYGVSPSLRTFANNVAVSRNKQSSSHDAGPETDDFDRGLQST